MDTSDDAVETGWTETNQQHFERTLGYITDEVKGWRPLTDACRFETDDGKIITCTWEQHIRTLLRICITGGETSITSGETEEEYCNRLENAVTDKLRQQRDRARDATEAASNMHQTARSQSSQPPDSTEQQEPSGSERLDDLFSGPSTASQRATTQQVIHPNTALSSSASRLLTGRVQASTAASASVAEETAQVGQRVAAPSSGVTAEDARFATAPQSVTTEQEMQPAPNTQHQNGEPSTPAVSASNWQVPKAMPAPEAEPASPSRPGWTEDSPLYVNLDRSQLKFRVLPSARLKPGPRQVVENTSHYFVDANGQKFASTLSALAQTHFRLHKGEDDQRVKGAQAFRRQVEDELYDRSSEPDNRDVSKAPASKPGPGSTAAIDTVAGNLTQDLPSMRHTSQGEEDHFLDSDDPVPEDIDIDNTASELHAFSIPTPIEGVLATDKIPDGIIDSLGGFEALEEREAPAGNTPVRRFIDDNQEVFDASPNELMHMRVRRLMQDLDNRFDGRFQMRSEWKHNLHEQAQSFVAEIFATEGRNLKSDNDGHAAGQVKRKLSTPAEDEGGAKPKKKHTTSSTIDSKGKGGKKPRKQGRKSSTIKDEDEDEDVVVPKKQHTKSSAIDSKEDDDEINMHTDADDDDDGDENDDDSGARKGKKKSITKAKSKAANDKHRESGRPLTQLDNLLTENHNRLKDGRCPQHSRVGAKDSEITLKLDNRHHLRQKLIKLQREVHDLVKALKDEEWSDKLKSSAANWNITGIDNGVYGQQLQKFRDSVQDRSNKKTHAANVKAESNKAKEAKREEKRAKDMKKIKVLLKEIGMYDKADDPDASSDEDENVGRDDEDEGGDEADFF